MVPAGVCLIPTSVPLAFSRRLREHTVHETQATIARRLGCTPGYVGQILRAEVRPSRAIVERIIESYKLPRDEWLDLAGYGEHPAEDPVEQVAARVVDKLRADFEHLFREREENPQDYYHRRFGELAMVCAERGIQLVPPRFSGGSQSLETVEQAEGVITHLAEMLVESHPEHAEALRAVAGEP